MNIRRDPLQEVHGVHINICIALKTKVSAVEVIFLQEIVHVQRPITTVSTAGWRRRQVEDIAVVKMM